MAVFAAQKPGALNIKQIGMNLESTARNTAFARHAFDAEWSRDFSPNDEMG